MDDEWEMDERQRKNATGRRNGWLTSIKETVQYKTQCSNINFAVDILGQSIVYGLSFKNAIVCSLN